MATFAHVLNGLVAEPLVTPPAGVTIAEMFAPGLIWVDVTALSPQPAPGWTVTETAGAWTFTAPPAPPVPTLAQQATAALAAGVTITSTATPALNGLYACDVATQNRLSRMYNLIQRGDGASFPNSLSALPWTDMAGAVHTFATVTEFLAFESAIGGYALTLELIIATGAGTLPPATAPIP
jgi:hypothetical protein